jgi:anti-sigma B factor antagonist
MEIQESKQDGVVVLALAGRLDGDSAIPLQEHVQEWIGRGEIQFVIDAAALTYISSSGMRLFLELAKRLETQGGGIMLCAVQEPVRRVLEIAGLFSKFHVSESLTEAVHRCRAGRPQ